MKEREVVFCKNSNSLVYIKKINQGIGIGYSDFKPCRFRYTKSKIVKLFFSEPGEKWGKDGKTWKVDRFGNWEEEIN
ncbi:MAG: hypothetical protein WC445_04985 [Patescibacteria group bacterium]|jgi:hypothetical protein